MRDTDDDGLTDLEEIEGTDFLIAGGIDDVRYPNPLAYDTDRDGLSDGEEANDPWTVKVTGQDPFLAYSDPTRSDADLDGLSDYDEKNPAGRDDSHQSDPNEVDTDGDGTSDHDEIDPSDDVDLASDVSRNPTIPDQVVEFRYANATVLETCYLIAGEGGTDGWSAPFIDQQLLHALFGGNDGGYAWLQLGLTYFHDGGGTAIITIEAPTDFHGDQSDQDMFSFDLKQVQAEGEQSRFDPSIGLRGLDDNGDELVLYYEYDTGDNDWHESTSWDTLDIPLEAASGSPADDAEGVWRVDDDDTDEPATDAQLTSVLSSVTELTIAGPYEYPSSFEGVALAGISFDNMRFTDASDGSHGAVSRFDTGSITSGNYSGNFKIEYPSAGGGLTAETLVTANEFSQSTAGTTTALDEAGTTKALDEVADSIIQFVVGEEQGFRAYSTDIIEESEAYTLGRHLWAYANYGHLSTDYDYPVVGGNESEVLRGQSHDNERTCSLDVSWTWRVVQ
ncbi:MAG: hypothetical protein U5K81_11865 [Trueperaceae bacterium]|nr:hypothetical protein [Trueperaceae bacterium]